MNPGIKETRNLFFKKYLATRQFANCYHEGVEILSFALTSPSPPSLPKLVLNEVKDQERRGARSMGYEG